MDDVSTNKSEFEAAILSELRRLLLALNPHLFRETETEGSDAAATLPPVDPVHRARLVAFCSARNCALLPSVAATLRRHAGHEELLFERLVAQDGAEPAPPAGGWLVLPEGWEAVETVGGDAVFRRLGAAEGDAQWRHPAFASEALDFVWGVS